MEYLYDLFNPQSVHWLVLFQVFPWVLFSIILWFARDERLLTFIIVVLTMAAFWWEYRSNEIYLYAFGILFGFLIEAVSGLVYRIQHWKNASLMGVPYWLPFLWGISFVIIHRIGGLLVGA